MLFEIFKPTWAVSPPLYSLMYESYMSTVFSPEGGGGGQKETKISY